MHTPEHPPVEMCGPGARDLAAKAGAYDMIAKHIAMNTAGKSSFPRLVRYLTDTQGKEVRTGAVRITNCISDSAEVVALGVVSVQGVIKSKGRSR